MLLYIAYIAMSDPPPKKTATSLTGDINPKVPNETMEKWKLHVILPTSKQKHYISSLPSMQAIILYFCLCSNFPEIAMPNAKYKCRPTVQSDYFFQ